MFWGLSSTFSVVKASCSAVGRPRRPEPRARHAPDGLAGAPHDEDAAAVAAGAERDSFAVRGEDGLVVVVGRVSRQVEGILPSDALQVDVAGAGARPRVDDPLSVGRQGREPLDAGLRGQLQELGAKRRRPVTRPGTHEPREEPRAARRSRWCRRRAPSRRRAPPRAAGAARAGREIPGVSPDAESACRAKARSCADENLSGAASPGSGCDFLEGGSDRPERERRRVLPRIATVSAESPAETAIARSIS